MKVLGIIAEYNPFHNGHLYHLNKSREITDAAYTVCVMSGNFIQRGEPAIINKWARTRMALSAGIDLVIELPSVYAFASAEFFAFGAVKLLDATGVVNTICFGSESGRIDELEQTADILKDEPPEYRGLLAEMLEKGLSFPAARAAAMEKYLSRFSNNNFDAREILASSNNILGVEYIKALKRLKSAITPVTIKRIGNDYNSPDIDGPVSSATSIRNLIMKSGNCHDESLTSALPSFSAKVLEEEFAAGKGPIFPETFEKLILALFRRMPPEQVKELPYVTEGLENRLKQAADKSTTLSEFIDNVSTRRYTTTRIQRILFNALSGMTSQEFAKFYQNGGPQYIRVLGFSDAGRELLAAMKETASLPVIIKTANLKYLKNPLAVRMFEIENILTDIYVLGYENPNYRAGGQEYTQKVIMQTGILHTPDEPGEAGNKA